MQYIKNLKRYYFPINASDASKMLLQETNSEIIAGGTELLVSNFNNRDVQTLIDITRCNLSYVKNDKKSIKIGATTTISEIQHLPLFKDYACGILSYAASKFVSVQIRNVATVGGNVAAAMPSSDLIPVLMVLDAKINVVGKENKEFPINGFFISKRKTVLAPYEVISEIELPFFNSENIGCSFKKLGRTQSDIAIVNGAALIEINDDKSIKKARLALGSVASNVIRCIEVENELIGKKPTADEINAICEKVTKSIDPKTDVRASAKYRQMVSKVIAARLISEAYEKAGGRLK